VLRSARHACGKCFDIQVTFPRPNYYSWCISCYDTLPLKLGVCSPKVPHFSIHIPYNRLSAASKTQMFHVEQMLSVGLNRCRSSSRNKPDLFISATGRASWLIICHMPKNIAAHPFTVNLPRGRRQFL